MGENIFLKRSVLEYELPDFAHLEEEQWGSDRCFPNRPSPR
jgi:hypothetical protein